MSEWHYTVRENEVVRGVFVVQALLVLPSTGRVLISQHFGPGGHPSRPDPTVLPSTTWRAFGPSCAPLGSGTVCPGDVHRAALDALHSLQCYRLLGPDDIARSGLPDVQTMRDAWAAAQPVTGAHIDGAGIGVIDDPIDPAEPKVFRPIAPGVPVTPVPPDDER